MIDIVKIHLLNVSENANFKSYRVFIGKSFKSLRSWYLLKPVTLLRPFVGLGAKNPAEIGPRNQNERL